MSSDQPETRPSTSRLAAVPIFSSLSESQLERVASWAEVRQVSEGVTLASEGASGYSFFVIEEGTASVVHDGAVVATLGPGEFFGEGAILGGGRRNASVTAATPMTLFALFGTQFRQLTAEMPEIGEAIEATLKNRLEALES